MLFGYLKHQPNGVVIITQPLEPYSTGATTAARLTPDSEQQPAHISAIHRCRSIQRYHAKETLTACFLWQDGLEQHPVGIGSQC